MKTRGILAGLALLLLAANPGFAQPQPQPQPKPQPELGTPQGFIPSRKKYAPINADSVNIDPVTDSLNRYRTERPVSGSHRKGDNPELFLIGDSTLRTEIDGNGSNGQWGWGYYLQNYFDSDRITVENHALGGESTRSYYKTWLFHTLRGVKPGDWVIVQIGHNDRTNGAEMNDGRFRGILPGTGKEYKEVILPGNGTRERIYTYGEYLRIYVDEIRRRGANPLLLSLTQRNSFGRDGKANPDGKTAMIQEIAQELDVPFIDFNAAIRYKYDNVFDPLKIKYLYFSDAIHSSSFGAVINAETFVEELRKRPDIGLSEFLLPETHYESAVRKDGKPVLFAVGDCAKKLNWKQIARSCADTGAMTVDNRCKAGSSARTYLNEGLWNEVYGSLQPGDCVLVCFDNIDGEFPGNDDEKEIVTDGKTGINEGVYSYGWYLRKFCLDAKEKGAVPVILSHKEKEEWAKAAAEQIGVSYIKIK